MAKISLDGQYFKRDKDGKPCYGKILSELPNGCCSVVLYDDRDKNGNTLNFSFKRGQLEDENCELTPDRSSWYPELLEELRAKYLESFNIFCEQLRQNPYLPADSDRWRIFSEGKGYESTGNPVNNRKFKYWDFLVLDIPSCDSILALATPGYTKVYGIDVKDVIDVNDVQALLEPFFEESLKAKVQEMCS